MCAPMAIASFALSTASQVLAFKGQQKQAEAANKAYTDAAISAGKSLNDQTSQEGVRLQQEQASAVEKQLDLRREALQAKGTALASSEGGGLSEELLLADIDRQQATYSDAVATNLRNQFQQSYWNKQGMTADAQSRANANKPTGGAGVSGLGLGLGVLGAGLSTYNDYHIGRTKDIKTAPK